MIGTIKSVRNDTFGYNVLFQPDLSAAMKKESRYKDASDQMNSYFSFKLT